MSFSPILGNPKPQYEDSNGVPYVGMRLFFYQAGTSTKQDTATDSGGLTTNTNPVVFDANGYPSGNVMIYGDNDFTYKIVAAPPGSDDPPTSPLWTIDNITWDSATDELIANLASTALDDGTKGFHLVYYPLSAEEQTAGVTPVNYEYYYGDFKRYGAAGDGVTNDTTALQTALDYGLSSGYSIEPSPGNYLTNASLTLTDVGFYIDGKSAVTITSTAAGPILDFDSPDPVTRAYFRNVIIKGLFLRGDGVNTTYGIKLYGAAYANSVIEDVDIRGATTYFIYLEQCWAIEIVNCQLGFGSESRTTTGTVGIHVTNANAIAIRDSIISSIGDTFDGIGIEILSGEAVNIEDNTIENMDVGIDIQSGSGPVVISGNYFEESSAVQGTRDITIPFVKIGTTSSVEAFSINYNWFLIGNNARNIQIAAADGGEIIGNRHNPGFANDGYYFIDAGCTNITAKNNVRFYPITSAIDAGQYASTLAILGNIDEDTFFVDASRFIIRAGSPTYALFNDIPSWGLDDATTESVSAITGVPMRWGACTIKTRAVFGTAATSGVATVAANPVAIASDGTEAITVGTNSTNYTVSTTANSAKAIGYFQWITVLTPNDVVSIKVQRGGGGGSDTLVGDLSFLGVIVQRVKP